MSVATPTTCVRPLSAAQVAQLRSRLEAAVAMAESLRGIHAVYAAEANAYRRVLATLDDL